MRTHLWIVVVAGVGLLPGVTRAQESFGRFLQENKDKVTPQGTIGDLYHQAKKANVLGQLRPKTGRYLGGALGVGFVGIAQLKKVQPAMKWLGRFFRTKVLGEAAYEVGVKDAFMRKRSLGEHVTDVASVAAWMLPKVKKVMPGVYAATLASTIYAGSQDVKEGITLARGQVLAVARQAGIGTGGLLETYRQDIGKMKQGHQDAVNEAVAKIKEHRPLLAKARIAYRKAEGMADNAKLLGEKIWHEEILHRAFDTARVEKAEVKAIQGVLDKMKQVGQ